MTQKQTPTCAELGMLELAQQLAMCAMPRGGHENPDRIDGRPRP
ncbi:hypothetical protein [Paraburkholderia sp. RL17-373-BIF-A]